MASPRPPRAASPTWATPFCSSASPVCSCWFFKSSCWFWARRLRRRMPASSPCRTPDCSSPWKPQPIWSPCWPPGSSFPCSGNAAFSTECAGIGQRRAARRQSSSPLACCWEEQCSWSRTSLPRPRRYRSTNSSSRLRRHGSPHSSGFWLRRYSKRSASAVFCCRPSPLRTTG